MEPLDIAALGLMDDFFEDNTLPFGAPPGPGDMQRIDALSSGSDGVSDDSGSSSSDSDDESKKVVVKKAVRPRDEDDDDDDYEPRSSKEDEEEKMARASRVKRQKTDVDAPVIEKPVVAPEPIMIDDEEEEEKEEEKAKEKEKEADKDAETKGEQPRDGESNLEARVKSLEAGILWAYLSFQRMDKVIEAQQKEIHDLRDKVAAQDSLGSRMIYLEQLIAAQQEEIQGLKDTVAAQDTLFEHFVDLLPSQGEKRSNKDGCKEDELKKARKDDKDDDPEGKKEDELPGAPKSSGMPSTSQGESTDQLGDEEKIDALKGLDEGEEKEDAAQKVLNGYLKMTLR